VSGLLKQAREACGLTASDLAGLTRLSPRVIAALEEERYRDLPPGIYARMSVRAYARAVRLDPLTTLRELEPLLPVVSVDLAAVAALRAPEGRPRAARYALAATIDAVVLAAVFLAIVVVCGAACGTSAAYLLRTAPVPMGFLCSIAVVTYFWVLGATDVRTAGPWLLDLEILPPARRPMTLDELARRGVAYVTAELTLVLSQPYRTAPSDAGT
jgi:cytoskeleton protein RodZ